MGKRTSLGAGRGIETPAEGDPVQFPAVLVVEGLALGRRYVLGDSCDIGRDPWCAIRLDDRCVSRRHARLERRGGQWFVDDHNSRNGTFVNGKRVTRIRLWPGDRVGLGAGVVLLFAHIDAIEQHRLRDDRLRSLGGMARSVASELSELLNAVESSIESGDVAAAREQLEQGRTFARSLESFAAAGDPPAREIGVLELLESVSATAKGVLARKTKLSIAAEDGLVIEGSRDHLVLALCNLCAALEHGTEGKPTITVSGRGAVYSSAPAQVRGLLETGAFVRIDVSVDGRVELDPARAFDPFAAGDERLPAGLGLSVAYGVVRDHEGDVLVTFTEDKTRFSLFLPQVETDTSSELLESPTEAAPLEGYSLGEAGP